MKQRERVYQRIDGSQWRHIWLVGDIHGCLTQLRTKLWNYRFDPWQDLLISVGDVIDRGLESLRCLQLLVKWSTKTGHRVRVFPVSIFRFVWG